MIAKISKMVRRGDIWMADLRIGTIVGCLKIMIMTI